MKWMYATFKVEVIKYKRILIISACTNYVSKQIIFIEIDVYVCERIFYILNDFKSVDNTETVAAIPMVRTWMTKKSNVKP